MLEYFNVQNSDVGFMDFMQQPCKAFEKCPKFV